VPNTNKWNFKFIRRAIYTLLLCCYILIVLYLTLFGRTIYQGDPLGIIFGGWDFRMPEEGGDVHAFYNLFMLAPFTFLLLSILPDKDRTLLRLILISVAFSFALSCVIEVCQVIFYVGTLQISDLVYNTISGVIGATAYYIVIVSKNCKLVKQD
jgi:glycopeptide antibiotics resistance protein